MNEAERNFYEWFHANHFNGGSLLAHYREAYLAGWKDAEESENAAARERAMDAAVASDD